MNFIFLTFNAIPSNTASFNRTYALCKGVNKSGHSSTIISLSQENEGKGAAEYLGVDFISFLEKKHCITKIERVLRYFYVFLASIIKILIYRVTKRIHALIITRTVLPILVVYYFLCKILNIKFVLEISEFPDIEAKKSIIFKLNVLLFNNLYIRLFDFIAVISIPLLNYFKNKKKKNAKLFLLPIIVENERFDLNSYNNDKKNKYFAYCGSMGSNGDGESKDGVDILIKAFSIVTRKYEGFFLMLIGTAKDYEIEILKKIAEDEGIQERVKFCGLVERDKLPNLLANSFALTLSRPNNRQAEGGFPTKLGEYLATGRPTIVTNVGDISRYLVDNVNAFIAIPDSIDSFAEKMMFCIDNEDIATKVGLQGKDLAFEKFNYIKVAKIIIDEINTCFCKIN